MGEKWKLFCTDWSYDGHPTDAKKLTWLLIDVISMCSATSEIHVFFSHLRNQSNLRSLLLLGWVVEQTKKSSYILYVRVCVSASRHPTFSCSEYWLTNSIRGFRVTDMWLCSFYDKERAYNISLAIWHNRGEKTLFGQLNRRRSWSAMDYNYYRPISSTCHIAVSNTYSLTLLRLMKPIRSPLDFTRSASCNYPPCSVLFHL